MPIYFHMEFQLEDSTSTLKVVLKGQNAVGEGFRAIEIMFEVITLT